MAIDQSNMRTGILFLFFFCGLLVDPRQLLSFRAGESSDARRLRDGDPERSFQENYYRNTRESFDRDVEDSDVVEIIFRNSDSPENHMKLVLDIEEVEHYSNEPVNGIWEDYLIIFPENTDYHSIQLLAGRHNETGVVTGEQRRQLWGWVKKVVKVVISPAQKALDAAKSAWNKAIGEANKLRTTFNTVASQAANKLREVADLRKLWDAAKSHMNKGLAEVKKLGDKIKGFKSELNRLKGWYNSAKDSLGKALKKVKDLGLEFVRLTKKLADIPKLFKTKVIDPVDNGIRGAIQDVSKITDIANTLADTVVGAIKKLNFLPTSGQALADLLIKGLLDSFAKGLCVPYQVLATRFGLTLPDISLYQSSLVSISTQVRPSTCLDIMELKFDISKLGNFLNLFKGLEALKDIYNKVKKYVGDVMNKILGFAKDLGGLFNDVERLVDNAMSAIGLRRLEEARGLRGSMAEVEAAQKGAYANNLTLADAQIIAYHAGRNKFEELYGEHVLNVFQEHRVLQNGKSFIGITSLKLRVKANFAQDLTLEASKRTGYANSIFDESLHQSVTVPVPFTAGLMNIVASGTVEGSMPYAISMDAQAKAVFGYEVGEVDLIFDMIQGSVTFSKQPFKTKVQLDASVGISGYMALKFAASASLGICLGPKQLACLTVTIDADQESAAGFDAFAGFSYDKDVGKNAGADQLESMYQDVLTYAPNSKCSGNLGLAAGYWQYVKEPSVHIGLTGTSFDNLDMTLYDRPGQVIKAASLIHSECVAWNLKGKN